ncbi:hypothetical protein T06_2799 [Trichinella sp. T6]|nr:hypothetical protein T06_2799 [Trichinella sp. T6]
MSIDGRIGCYQFANVPGDLDVSLLKRLPLFLFDGSCELKMAQQRVWQLSLPAEGCGRSHSNKAVQVERPRSTSATTHHPPPPPPCQMEEAQLALLGKKLHL